MEEQDGLSVVKTPDVRFQTLAENTRVLDSFERCTQPSGRDAGIVNRSLVRLALQSV